MLFPPWDDPPEWIAVNGHPMQVVAPSTVDLAWTLRVPDDRCQALYVVLACTNITHHRWLYEQIFGQQIADDLLDDVADVLIERIVGWKRWEATHLWAQTLAAWRYIDGDLSGRGIDLSALPPARATNTAFGWWRDLYKGSDEFTRFMAEVEKEPRRIIRRKLAAAKNTPKVLPAPDLGEFAALAAR